MEFEVETRYERCKALIQAVDNGDIPDESREALLWMFEEEFDKLGEAIEKAQSKSA